MFWTSYFFTFVVSAVVTVLILFFRLTLGVTLRAAYSGDSKNPDHDHQGSSREQALFMCGAGRINGNSHPQNGIVSLKKCDHGSDVCGTDLIGKA